jgi:hypothetical protein
MESESMSATALFEDNRGGMSASAGDSVSEVIIAESEMGFGR